MKKTYREKYDDQEPVGPDSPTSWGERMRLYTAVLGEESEGMTPYQWFHYLSLPWDEKLAYSKQVKNNQ